MKQEGVERAVIVSCSVGSGIALLFGLDRPDMVDGLVLAGGSSRGGGSIVVLPAAFADYGFAHLH